VINLPTHADVSIPLRDMIRQPAAAVNPQPRLMHGPLPTKATRPSGAAGINSILNLAGPPLSATIGINVEGQGNVGSLNCPNVSGAVVAPPDTEGAVGDTQYVQWVNLCYTVFDKATGNVVAGPFAGNAFWNGFAGSCATTNDGDPVILFDHINHVWIASQNMFGPYATCVAVSQTADATGVWNRYQYTQPGFPDYPKWGVTPNVYFQTQNNFGTGSAYVGVTLCAYDGVAMRAGSSKAAQVCMVDNSNGTLFDDSMLPADFDKDAPAPAGKKAAPPFEILLGSIDNTNPGSNVYEYVFTPNFKQSKKSTLKGVGGSMPIAVPAYSLACGGFGACVPQPSAGSELLDSLGDRLMFRLAAYDDGTTTHFLVNHSVNDTAATAVAWYEFTAADSSLTSLSLAQTGRTPDDAEYRWMGSVARDTYGDIALGYSRSSTAAGDYPSIYLSGQAAGEPAGTTDAEQLAWQGGGSQSSTANRWGDYSAMSLDPGDLCTFWYTTEYYPADGRFAWDTRVVSLKFPSCP
jgi:hypothetical protein